MLYVLFLIMMITQKYLKIYHLDIAHWTKINYLSSDFNTDGLQNPANLIFQKS